MDFSSREARREVVVEQGRAEQIFGQPGDELLWLEAALFTLEF